MIILLLSSFTGFLISFVVFPIIFNLKFCAKPSQTLNGNYFYSMGNCTIKDEEGNELSAGKFK